MMECLAFSGIAREMGIRLSFNQDMPSSDYPSITRSVKERESSVIIGLSLCAKKAAGLGSLYNIVGRDFLLHFRHHAASHEASSTVLENLINSGTSNSLAVRCLTCSRSTLLIDSHFLPVVGLSRQLAVFNEEVRSAWGNTSFIFLYGDEAPWSIVWRVWKFGEEAEKTGLPVRTISMPGVNHFVSPLCSVLRTFGPLIIL